MRFTGSQITLRQILPLAIAMLTQCSIAFGQLGEGGTDGPEPQVILPAHDHAVPIRTASKEISESTDSLVKFVWETREAQRRRLLSTKEHTPWQIMHGLLGLRQDFLISHNGQAINGLDWIYTGPTYMNESWFQKSPHGGRAHPFSKPYWFEGHINQFLAILSMCNIPLDQQFATPQGPITMRDMLKNAQMTVNAKEEVTWTLWALSTYLPSDATWVNAAGEQWSIEKLVQIETGKKVGGPTSPCGGTHGLFALARARNVYLRTGKPLRGVWLEADQKIKRYIETARLLRNNDGSLSSAFFKQKEYKQDFDKRMASEGHVLEFLMMAVSQEQLKEPWVRKAIEKTANDLMNNRKAYVSCSPLYHATNALSIYLERVAPTGVKEMAKKPETATSVSNSKTLGPATAGKPGPVPPVPSSGVPGNSGSPAAPAAVTSPKGTAPAGEAPKATTPSPAVKPLVVQPPAPTIPSAQSPAKDAVPKPDEAKVTVTVPAVSVPVQKPAEEKSTPASQSPTPAAPATVSPTTSAPTAVGTAGEKPTSTTAAPALMPTPAAPQVSPPPTPDPVPASQSPTVVLPAPAEPISPSPPIDSVVSASPGSSSGPVADARFDRPVDTVIMPQPLAAVFRSVSQSTPSVQEVSTAAKTENGSTEGGKVAPEISPASQPVPGPASTSGPTVKPAQPSNGTRRSWRPASRSGRSGSGLMRR